MRFFQYTATNGSGLQVQAIIQAGSRDEAERQLAAQGLSGVQIQELGGGNSPTSAPAPAQNPVKRPAPAPRATPQPKVQPSTRPAVGPVVQPRVQSQPVSRPVETPAAAKPSQSTIRPTVATRRGRDSENHFLFVQLAAYFRSGTGLAQGLATLAQAHRRPEYRQALADASDAVGRGVPLSEAFEVYPDLFSKDLTATLRVGEASGNMAAAAEEIALRSLDSHKIKRRLFYFSAVIFVVALLIPTVLGIVQGSLNTVALQWEADGQLPKAQALGSGLAPVFRRLGPQLLVAAALLYAAYQFWNSRKLRAARHQAVLMTPFLGSRAKSEGIHRLTWAMTLLATGGKSPREVITLGAATIPNETLRRQFVERANSMRESERVSSVLNGMPHLDPSFRDLAETGEMTGNLPQMLAQMEHISGLEYRSKTDTVVWKMGFLIYPIVGAVVAIAVFFAFKAYVLGLLRIVQ